MRVLPSCLSSPSRRAAAFWAVSPLPAWAAGLVLFLEGYASLSVEVIGLRRLVPWSGSNVVVTAVVLAAYLAALAGGYSRGGAVAARTPPERVREMLAWRLALAAALSAFWLSSFAPQLVFASGLPPLLAVAFYSAAGIAPIGWLLAESILFVHRASAPADPTARAGSVFSLSTAGNVAGSLLTALVFFRYLGVGPTALLVTLALLAAALVASGRRLQVGVVAAALLVPLPMLWQDAVDLVASNAFADYRIVDIPGEERRLFSANLDSSSADTPDGVGSAYIELVEEGACASGPASVLVLGGGGQSFGRGRDCGLTIDFVDIDPAQEHLAPLFLHGPSRGVFHAADARRFLVDADRRWDVVFADVYTTRHLPPDHLVTVEFLRLVRSRLEPGGTFYFNFLFNPEHHRVRVRFDRTLRTVFADCQAQLSRSVDGWPRLAEMRGNLVYRCAVSEFDGDRAIYSDTRPLLAADRYLP